MRMAIVLDKSDKYYVQWNSGVFYSDDEYRNRIVDRYKKGGWRCYTKYLSQDDVNKLIGEYCKKEGELNGLPIIRSCYVEELEERAYPIWHRRDLERCYNDVDYALAEEEKAYAELNSGINWGKIIDEGYRYAI